MGIYIKSEGSRLLTIEGELTPEEETLLTIVNAEADGGWTYIGGKTIHNLEYFFPEEILQEFVLV
jgi:hypothetical protein